MIDSTSFIRNLTILVNTCDNYSDCWDPFFNLLSKNLNGINIEILLLTEFKDYTFPGLNIRAAKNSLNGNKILTWSENLLAGLDKVETDYVLYFQEDYFLEKKCDISILTSAIQKMTKDKKIQHIGLTHFGSGLSKRVNSHELFVKIPRFSSYRISTQVGLWRVSCLKSYLSPIESGWEFEMLGTIRAWIRNEEFLSVNPNFHKKNSPPFSYGHTGIIKGKWSRFVVDLFDKNGIKVDYSIRGFYTPINPFIRKLKTIFNIFRNPINFFRMIYLEFVHCYRSYGK